MQAVILAAGMGKRLHTEKNKCLVSVQGISLWNRMIAALRVAEISKLVVVTGYRANELETYILSHSEGMDVSFVRNTEYEKSNNIWSLFLAKEKLQEDTILLEADLIYEDHVIRDLCDSIFPNAALIAKVEPWMDGTKVELNQGYIQHIVSKKDSKKYQENELYKTVNIYKFSSSFLRKDFLPAMEQYIEQNGKQDYYEMALQKVVEKNDQRLAGVLISSKWYEIDTAEDLQEAEKIFE